MATHKFVGDVGVTSNIKSSTTDASLYNLGAYDSVVDNGDGTVTITRQTGYISAEGDWAPDHYESWYRYYIYVDITPDFSSTGEISLSSIAANYKIGRYLQASGTSEGVSIAKDSTGYYIGFISTTEKTAAEINALGIQIQYRSAVSRTETVIKDRPLSQLSAEGERYVDGLHIAQINDAATGGLNKGYAGTGDLNVAGYGVYLVNSSEFKYYRNSTSTNSYMYIDLLDMGFKPNTTYTLVVYGSTFQDVQIYINSVKTFTQTGNEYTQSSVQISYTFTMPSTFWDVYVRLITPFNGAAIGSVSSPVTCRVMLNEGFAPLPYQPYDASGHITHPEAKLLLDEYEKTANLACSLYKVNNWGAYFKFHAKPNTTYFLKVNSDSISSSTSNSYVWLADLSFNEVSGERYHNNDYSTKNRKGFSFTTGNIAEGDYYLYTQFNVETDYSAGVDALKVMINEGSEPLPYVLYHGPIVHEGDAGVLLWKNGLPDNAFAAQTITIADMSKYKYVDVGYKMWRTNNICLHQKYDVQFGVSTTMFYSTSTYTHARDITFNSATSITFSATDLDGTLVPVAIRGTNIS